MDNQFAMYFSAEIDTALRNSMDEMVYSKRFSCTESTQESMYPQCANPVFLDTRQENRRKNNRDHDMLLGGKVDSSFSPSLVNRMNLIALRPDQCPFQFFIPVNAYWSPRSGIQSPVVNSRSSTSTRSFSASSRLLGGRPLRRSDWSS